MTFALAGYSGVFMRYAMAVTPVNYLLFGCHVVNFTAQCTQGYRYVDYNYMGGKQKYLDARAKEGLNSAGEKIEGAAKDIKDKVQDLAGQAKAQVEKATR